jgi:hypothetical protein
VNILDANQSNVQNSKFNKLKKELKSSTLKFNSLNRTKTITSDKKLTQLSLNLKLSDALEAKL